MLEPGEHKATKQEKVKLVPGDPRDVALINRIFKMYAYGCYGINRLCRQLNDEGVPSPNGRRWGPDIIYHILKNRAYIGELTYGGTRFADKVTEKIVTPNAHEAIVPIELFEAAQEVKRKRGFGHGSFGASTDYLLSGKILCPDCGHKLQGRKKDNKQGKIYYRYQDPGADIHKICKAVKIDKDEVEGFVLQCIESLINDGDYEARFREHLTRLLISIEREANDRTPLLERKLRQLENEIENIIDELLKVKSAALRERLSRRENEKAAIEQELRSLRTVNKAPSQVVNLVNRYMKALKHVAAVIRTREPGEQKAAVDIFLEKGELHRAEGLIRFFFYGLPEMEVAAIDYRVSLVGAGGRNRTDTRLPSLDFESSASTSFTTPAISRNYKRMDTLVSRRIDFEYQVSSWRGRLRLLSDGGIVRIDSPFVERTWDMLERVVS